MPTWRSWAKTPSRWPSSFCRPTTWSRRVSRAEWASGSARAEPSGTPDRAGQLLDLDHGGDLGADYEQLSDPVARRDPKRLRAVGVQQQHAQLAPVARIDQPRCVDE